MKRNLKGSIVKINEYCFQFTIAIKDGKTLHSGVATSRDNAVRMAKNLAEQHRQKENV